MIDQLIKVVLLIGGAITTYLVADKVTETYTGKHIHEHVFEWYRRLSDKLSAWLQVNQDKLRINKILIVALDYFDEAVCRTKKMADKITIAVYGVSEQKDEYKVTEEEVSIEEAVEIFPGLAENAVLELEV